MLTLNNLILNDCKIVGEKIKQHNHHYDSYTLDTKIIFY